MVFHDQKIRSALLGMSTAKIYTQAHNLQINEVAMTKTNLNFLLDLEILGLHLLQCLKSDLPVHWLRMRRIYSTDTTRYSPCKD